MMMLGNELLEESGLWYTRCCECDWCDNTLFRYQGDCEINTCPKCDSDNIEDINQESELYYEEYGC